MLDTEQYAAIGKIAVACSRIKYLIRDFAAHCVGSPEFDIANSIIDKYAMFGQVKEAFGRVLKAVASEYPRLRSRVQAVKTSLEKASELAAKRNTLMHGMVELDPITKMPTMKGRQTLSCDQRELDRLAVEATNFYDEFCDVCGALFEDLAEARAKP